MGWISFFAEVFNSGKKQKVKVSNCVIGIGNYDKKYEGTRHNIGFEIADCLAKRLQNCEVKNLEMSSVCVGDAEGQKDTAVVKPFTFVNLSGRALEEILEKYEVRISRCLVVVDDFSLPLGKLRFRRNGSDGGHNGLRSIIETAGPDFPRLRVGIGPLPKNGSSVDFVLSRFSDRERPHVNKIVEKAAGAVFKFCTGDIEKVMGMYNSLDI